MGTPVNYSEAIKSVQVIANKDVHGLYVAEKSYGDSWKQRGGVGAFMMLARKWDRLENQVKKYSYDIFHAGKIDGRVEGILDDIRDLRRYLMLVESEILAASHKESQKDMTDGEAGESYINQDR